LALGEAVNSFGSDAGVAKRVALWNSSYFRPVLLRAHFRRLG
jgi:hypothetical protein